MLKALIVHSYASQLALSLFLTRGSFLPLPESLFGCFSSYAAGKWKKVEVFDATRCDNFETFEHWMKEPWKIRVSIGVRIAVGR
jgi:hypothetical protein